MRLFSYLKAGKTGIGARSGDDLVDLTRATPDLPRDLGGLLADGPEALNRARAAIDGGAPVLEPADFAFLPPIAAPSKIICIGLNYVDHAIETNFAKPDYPILFSRFASTLVGHLAPLICPSVSNQFDYEGELVAVIGRTARHVPKSQALEYVAGYSIFNDASVRDYQMRTHQWTMGKNFDGSGGFGPEFVTADELPPGAAGLRIQTRLNGRVLQDANTNDMIFGVADLISLISEAMTLMPGDLIVAGTPAGVGFTRTPPIFMQAGDVCEVEIDGIGLLRNPVIGESLVTDAGVAP